MAVAASEAAVKRFIADRIPDWSQSLVTDAQQVPLNKMMNDVIPSYLKTTSSFASPELPKKQIVTPIWGAVESRNVAIHQPPDSPKSKKLVETLDHNEVITLLSAVSDLLYFLDYFSGETWAIDMVSTKSREDWLRRNPPG